MGLFNHNDDSTSSSPSVSTSCPVPEGLTMEALGQHGSSHRIMFIIAGVCAAITLVSSLGLILWHLINYRVPKQQRQIIRIAFIPFVFAVVSFGEIADYNVATYIDPIGDFYEAICLCAFFLLCVQYALPETDYDSDLFDRLQRASAAAQLDSGKPSAKPAANWPRMSWVLVFQYPLTELVSIIVQEATQAEGKYCLDSLNPKYGHLWAQIISSVGIAACVLSILRFQGRIKPAMKANHAMSKLLCFKLIVAVRFLQNWIFSALNDSGLPSESAEFSYGDAVFGLKNTILAGEMILFSVAFWIVFSGSQYSTHAISGRKPLNFFHALADAMNPSDFLIGTVRMVSLFAGMRSSRQQYEMVQPKY